MLSFSTGQYLVELSDATANYADFASQFDEIYIDAGGNPATVVAVKLYNDEETIRSVLLGAQGGHTGIYKSNSIIESDKIVVCCGDSIFCISIPDLRLRWKTKADWVTCFQIFKYRQDYIVHGEVEITRVSEFGQIIWQRSGADIFVTLDGSGKFEVTDIHILATDWNGIQYKFDFDGNTID